MSFLNWFTLVCSLAAFVFMVLTVLTVTGESRSARRAVRRAGRARRGFGGRSESGDDGPTIEADAQRWAARQLRDRAVRSRAEEIIQSRQGDTAAVVEELAEATVNAFPSEGRGAKPFVSGGRGYPDKYRDSWLDQETARVTFTADLDPLGFAAVHRLLKAIEEGVEGVVVTQPDLARAVKELAHGSPSVGAHRPESREAVAS